MKLTYLLSSILALTCMSGPVMANPSDDLRTEAELHDRRDREQDKDKDRDKYDREHDKRDKRDDRDRKQDDDDDHGRHDDKDRDHKDRDDKDRDDRWDRDRKQDDDDDNGGHDDMDRDADNKDKPWDRQDDDKQDDDKQDDDKQKDDKQKDDQDDDYGDYDRNSFMRVDCRYHNDEKIKGIGHCYASAIYIPKDGKYKHVRVGAGCDQQTIYNDRGRVQTEEVGERISPITAAFPGIEIFPHGALINTGTYESVLDIRQGRLKGVCYVHALKEPHYEHDFEANWIEPELE